VKAKTIRQTLRRKIDDWAKSIEDEELRKLVLRDTVVTGGCIASMLLREPVNDYDVYFRTAETTRRVAEYYVGRFKVKDKAGIEVPLSVWCDHEGDKITRVKVVVKSAGVASEDGTTTPYEYFEGRPDTSDAANTYVGEVMDDPEESAEVAEEAERLALEADDELNRPRYRPVFLSTNAITLSHKIQVVVRFFGEPDEIHENYDFAHCTCYWTSRDDGQLVLRPAAMEALLTRELRYVGSKYPLCSLIRLRKFIQRGWAVNAGQILKMVIQLQDLNLKDPKVLQDQLTGVDASYFAQMMAKVKEKDPDKIDGAYLVEVINRLF
jgi:hypothetical protein